MPEEQDHQIERRQAGHTGCRSQISRRGTDAARFIQGLAKRVTGDRPRYSASPDFRYEFLTEWGEQGTKPSQFVNPTQLAIDANGNVYVIDSGNDRIQVFDPHGNFLYEWGEHGTEEGKFIGPSDLALDGTGNVYVAEPKNARIQVFDHHGHYLYRWRGHNYEDGHLSRPESIALGTNQDVYVTNGFKIEVFSRAGNFLFEWGGWSNNELYAQVDGAIDETGAIRIDSNGVVFVSDVGFRVLDPDPINHCVQAYTPQGTPLCTIGRGSPYSSEEGELYFEYPRFSASYFEPIQSYLLNGLGLDSETNLYVTDSGNSRVQVFDDKGQFLFTWGESGDGDGQFHGPTGLTLGRENNVYVADTGNHRIQVFKRVHV